MIIPLSVQFNRHQPSINNVQPNISSWSHSHCIRSGPDKCVRSNHRLVIRLSDLWDSYTSSFMKFSHCLHVDGELVTPRPGFDFDIWWLVWPCDHHLLVIFITTSANEDIPVPNTSDIWKCLRLIKVDDIWVKFAKISDKNDFCTNFSITHCQIVCKRKCNANWWKNVSLQYHVPKMHTTSCVPSDIMLEISS